MGRAANPLAVNQIEEGKRIMGQYKKQNERSYFQAFTAGFIRGWIRPIPLWAKMVILAVICGILAVGSK